MIATLALMLQAAATPVPADAAALGRQLAETGMLATLMPMITAKETEELVAEHKTLTADEQAALRRTGAETAAAMRTKLIAVVGDAYAKALTPAELAQLVAFQKTPAAQRYRAAEPQVIAATMAAMAGADFKRDTWKTYCAAPGRRCPAK